LHAVEGAITALATAAIAWFTWTLWRSNEKMWAVTKVAADAADRSARAAIGIELPIIQIVPDGIGWGDTLEDGIQRHYCSVGQFTFKNVGRTKAFPTEFRCGWTLGATLPSEPIYQYLKTFGIGSIIEPMPGDEFILYT